MTGESGLDHDHPPFFGSLFFYKNLKKDESVLQKSGGPLTSGRTPYSKGRNELFLNTMALGYRKKRAQPGESVGGQKKRALDLAWAADDDVDEHEIIESDDEEGGSPRGRDFQDSDEEDDDDEALETKRIRMARKYLEHIDTVGSDEESSSDSSEGDQSDEDGGDDDRLGRKLQRSRLKRVGTLERIIADKISQRISNIEKSFPTTVQSRTATSKDWISAGRIKYLSGHDLTPTCVALQSTGEKALSGSKDHSVILWDVENATRLTTLSPSWKKIKTRNKNDINNIKRDRTQGEALAVACSDDGRYAAVGRRDATVSIFDIRANNSKNKGPVEIFTGHKAAVTCLAFRSQTLQLFSGSEDRCIRHYNLGEMLYIETLYGHQFGVTDIDCHTKELPVSVGRDRTARAWKMSEETHLIFRGGGKIQTADTISVIKDDWFLTGHEDGHLSLWMTGKKKAVATQEYAHGLLRSGTSTSSNVGAGIASVASLRCSDIAASGSNDGFLRFWKTETGETMEERSLEPLCKVPVEGYINDIAFGPKAKFCLVAVGQEHKWGRWNRVPKAKNRIAIVRLQDPPTSQDDEDSEESSNE